MSNSQDPQNPQDENQDQAQVTFMEEDIFEGELSAMIQEEEDQDQGPLPEALPILTLRNTVLFPGVVVPITVAREKSLQLIKQATGQDQQLVGVVAQKEMETEDPGADDIYTTGTLASILRRMKMPDGSITIIIQGRRRIQLESFRQEQPYIVASYSVREEMQPSEEEANAMLRNLKHEAARIIELSPNIPSEANNTLERIGNLNFLVNFISANLNLDVGEKQEILEEDNLRQKAQTVLERLSRELHVLEISEEIQSRVKSDLDKQQRDYILRQQMKSIQEELGEGAVDNEVEELMRRAEEKDWPQRVQDAFDKELNKLNRINPGSPEYAVAINYIETLLDLPWREFTEDRLDLDHAREVLDNDHYGLEKVKDRIIEYLAVLKLKKDMKAPILCFYGPPGVGKTSLGRSIATSLNRNFIRMSLGGVRDEAEIRGHRRTYIGAMPGRILQSMIKAGSGNPVMMLDEIDKVGNDFRGDPSSALLEVLDPEQNNAFNDHYIELDYDLSPTMFIATANTLETIHPALRDRMEVIEINGYTREEKEEIAKRHLVPKVLGEHGLKKSQVKFADQALQLMISRYTRESGVRELSRKIANVCRSLAKDIVQNKFKSVTISQKKAEDYLGAPPFEAEYYEKIQKPGVAIGLAWTQVGGEILFVETVLTPGKGRLHLTGSLGDVMKESGQLAYAWLQANAETFEIPYEVFKYWDVHIHVPAGAIPKDGPSAGSAILTALASLFTQRKAREHLAMTGEITLRGRVMPVGGIKEKVLAAVRAGVTTLLLSKENEKDVKEIQPKHLIEDITIRYVDNMQQVLEQALEPKQIPNPARLLPASELAKTESARLGGTIGSA